MAKSKGPAASPVESAKALTRANRQRCAELVTLIDRKMKDIRDGFYEVGTALAEINNNKLFLAGGYDTFVALLEAHGFMGAAQANKLIAVAERLDREDAVVLGPEKAYALTRYAHAVGRGCPMGELLHQRDLVNGHSVQESSVRELVSATREAQASHGGANPRGAQRLAAQRVAREAQAALRKRGWEGVVVQMGGHAREGVFVLRMSANVLRKVAHLSKEP